MADPEKKGLAKATSLSSSESHVEETSDCYNQFFDFDMCAIEQT